MLDCLFSRFDNIIVLDTETTGLDAKKEEIIELAMLRLGPEGVREQYDQFIRLSPGRVLPPEIIQLTGITPQMLENEGICKQQAASDLARMLRCSRPLVVAYNAQFDLCFLYYLLQREGLAQALQGVGLLDAMTVYKDRRPFPHKLCNAIEAYALQGQNTHRAIDDTLATYELLCAMDAECSDLEQYLNLFGYNPKYGIPKPSIRSITYRPQSYHNTEKLYTKL